MNTKVKRLSALRYFGGKSRQLDWILPLLETEHINYVEPYCGSAAVFLNKRQSPIETINDLDGRLTNFFHVLRKHPKKLIEQLQLTPYSRKEYIDCNTKTKSSIEDARRFFVSINQSFSGTIYSRPNSWRINLKEHRHGISMEVSRFYRKISRLVEVAERLRMAQIDNRPAADIIKIYDAPDTLFYVDPPYLPEVRTGKNDYLHEMSIEDHIQLAEQINNCKGKFAVSTYENDLYNQLYPANKWLKFNDRGKIVNLGKSKKREVVYTNYQPNITGKLF